MLAKVICLSLPAYEKNFRRWQQVHESQSQITVSGPMA